MRVYLASSLVDMRQGHDGLMTIVKNAWSLDPYSGHIFVFLGRRVDRAKLLYWDRGGFVLIYKRLERGRFKPPKIGPNTARIELDGSQLALLLEGIDVDRVPRPRRWNPPPIKEGDRQDPDSLI